MDTKGQEDAGTSVGAAAGFAAFLVHAFWVLIFVAAAESIRVLLDVQANTQEAAFNTKS